MTSPETPARWVDVGPVSALTFTPGHSFMLDGREIAIFALEDSDGYAALDGSCPHAGGPLCEGDQDGASVSCPWHGWSFDLASGHCAVMPEASVRAYATRVVDGTLQVGVED